MNGTGVQTLNIAPDIMVERPCPLCASHEADAFVTAGDTIFGYPGTFSVVRCRLCSMLYTCPAVRGNRMAEFYPDQYSAFDKRRAAKQARRRSRKDVWDELPPIGQRRLLDVGCGAGGYLLRKKEAGWRVVGVEPSGEAVESARASGLEVLHGTVPGVDLTGRKFDAVVLLASLPCMPEPLETLRSIRTALVTGGRLIVSAHNAGSKAAELMGPCWPGWDLPRGLNHFTAASLTRMIERAGFFNVIVHGKRRSSRWRDGAAAMTRAGRAGLAWRLVGHSRALSRVAAGICSRGERSDELVAVAVG